MSEVSLKATGSLREVSDAHSEALMDYPALQAPRRCECADINLAGNLLVDIAAAYGLVITTGRVNGDNGQPTYVGYPTSNRTIRRSRPDHVLVSPSLFRHAQQSHVFTPHLSTTDHGQIVVNFCVPDFVPSVDWNLYSQHVCGMGRCASKMNLHWKAERQVAYVEELERNLEMPLQLETALDAGSVDTACFCLRSWIMQAATEEHVGMYKYKDCIFKRTEKQGIRRPVWFNQACLEKKRNFVQAVRSGEAVHACQFLKKEYRKQTRRARRAHDKYKKAVFLDRLQRHTPDIHELLKKPRTFQQTPITADGWSSYLGKHFASQESSQADGAFRNQAPADEMELPDAAALYPTVCFHMRRLNPRTSPGFGVITAPFIKYAERRVPAVNGRGTDRVNVLAPYVARLFAAMMDKAEIPSCWKAAKLTPLH